MAANRIDQLIDSWSPRLRRAFLDSIYQIRNQAQITQIANMLEAGDVDGALRAVGIDPVKFRPLDKALTDAFEAGGTYAAKAVPVIRQDGLRVVFQFNIRNPRAETWLSNYSGTLIQEIVDDQRNMVRQNLTRAMQRGINPRTAALDLVGRIAVSGNREGGVIGLTTSQEQWVANYIDDLSSDNPAKALTRELRDRRFDSRVLSASEGGEPLTAEQIETMAKSYTNRALRFRAEAIARTEAQTALHESQQQAMEQAVETGLFNQTDIKFIWRTSHDSRVRDSHIAMDGQVKKMGEPFISGLGNLLEYPGDPNAPVEDVINCRCFREPVVDFLAGIT